MRNLFSVAIVAVALLLISGGGTSLAFDFRKSLSDAVDKVEKTVKGVGEKKQETQDKAKQAQDAVSSPGAAASSAAGSQAPASQTGGGLKASLPGISTGGQTVFSKNPVDPKNLTNLTTSFKDGDHIYGLMQVKKTWRELYKAKDRNEVGLLLFFYVDGEKKTNMYVNLKAPQVIDSNYLVLDIAPSTDKMVNYKDANIVFSESRGLRMGPMLFTKELSQLSAGKHTLRFEIQNYGDILTAGEFQIEGSDFSHYAGIHEKIRSEDTSRRTMPAPGQTNKELEQNMIGLLKNAGWPDIIRLVIKDKDWWLDRASGGESPIVSRHMDAAAAAQDRDGSHYYCIVTFHQMRRIDGSFGRLELSHTGTKIPIPKENIFK